jgi:hypothetical protein
MGWQPADNKKVKIRECSCDERTNNMPRGAEIIKNAD